MLAACGAEEAPVPEAIPVKKPAAATPPVVRAAPPAAAPGMPPPVVVQKKEPAPSPEPPPAPPPRKKPPFVPPTYMPVRQDPQPTTANFTFRTMDHLKAFVIVNGERYSDTNCLWGYSLSYDFDPKIAVPQWPPKGAGFAGAATGKDEAGNKVSTIEIAIEGGLYDSAGQERLRKACPHLAPGEQVLYVKAEIQGKLYQGALRLKLVGEDGTIYRHTNYNPVQSMEDETASIFARSIWFQREKSE